MFNNRHLVKFSPRKNIFLKLWMQRNSAFKIFLTCVYLLSFSLPFSPCFPCPRNAPGTFGERCTTIVIPSLNKILSKITVDLRHQARGKEMTGWGNRMTSPWTFYLYLVYLRQDSFTVSHPCECLFWSNDTRYVICRNMVSGSLFSRCSIWHATMAFRLY